MANRVLVVDDDELVLRSVQRSLLRAGYTVLTATTGEQALAEAREHKPDLALVDFALGREDGLELLDRLREEIPGCLRVLMTGNRDFPVVVEAVNRGQVVRVLNKPFQPSDLVGMVQEAIDADKQRDQRATARLIEGAMVERRAFDECLRGRKLKLALQPIVSMEGDVATIFAYEALLRPQHERITNPAQLLAVAERIRRVPELSNHVLQLAADWVPLLPENVTLFVNLHPQQVGDPERLARALRPLLPYAARVTLEITERAPIHDLTRLEESVAWTVENGFTLALDDLGAGYNSLNMLATVSPKYIKIDMGMVRGIQTDLRKQRLVELLLTFANATNTETIAEGVETVQERDKLLELGVVMMQGHYFGAPSLEL